MTIKNVRAAAGGGGGAEGGGAAGRGTESVSVYAGWVGGGGGHMIAEA